MNEDLEPDQELLELSEKIDAFERYPHRHAARIVVLADAVARQFGLASHDRLTLQQAALVHDIGEMAMNRGYIGREGELTEEERIDLQRHPVIGEQVTARKGLPRAVQLIVRWHQEWWNGSGYPDGLEREQIPLAARILRVCDSYAALTDGRPHRGPVSAAEAQKHLTDWAGIEFDPKVVKTFLLLKDLDELASYADRD